MSDKITPMLFVSNRFRRLRMRGPRGIALECALVAFFIAFEAAQVLFVVNASAT